MRYLDKIFQRFKPLPIGIKRLFYAGTIVPFLLGILNHHQLGNMILFPIIYWILIFLGCWVYEGFKKPFNEVEFVQKRDEKLYKITSDLDECIGILDGKQEEMLKYLKNIEKSISSKVEQLKKITEKIRVLKEEDWYVLKIYIENAISLFDTEEYSAIEYFADEIAKLEEEENSFNEVKIDVINKLELYIEFYEEN